MPPIEHAIFTADEFHSATDYRIVARSAGLCESDAQELVVWCPTHDAMLEPNTESLNMHPLPSGAYCVSRTITVGSSLGGKGTQRSLTHCLIVPIEVLARFSNNAFALMRAALNEGVFVQEHPASSTLEPVVLKGGEAAVHVALLAELAQDPGPGNMAALVSTAHDVVCLALAGTPSPSKLIEGLVNCLPLPCRLDYSFSTGLKFSPRRPFRVMAISDDPAEQLWVGNHPNVTVFQTRRDTPAQPVTRDAWAQLIERVLATGQIAFLAAQLSKRRFDLTPDDLPALGLQLLEELDSGESCREDDLIGDHEPSPPTAARAHAAHYRFLKTAETAAAAQLRNASPSASLHTQSREVAEQLECLDDLVYDAINGHGLAMQQLRAVWPKISTELGDELLTESREQYLRYAISIWEESTQASEIRDSARAIHALDVLCLLFGDT